MLGWAERLRHAFCTYPSKHAGCFEPALIGGKLASHWGKLGTSHEEDIMNWDIISGRWTEMKGKLRSKWGKLTDDDVEVIAGKKDVLIGRLQQRYGLDKEEAERDVDRWLGAI